MFLQISELSNVIIVSSIIVTSSSNKYTLILISIDFTSYEENCTVCFTQAASNSLGGRGGQF